MHPLPPTSQRGRQATLEARARGALLEEMDEEEDEHSPPGDLDEHDRRDEETALEALPG